MTTRHEPDPIRAPIAAADMLDQLEPRTLLATTFPTLIDNVQWAGGEWEAMAGAWIVTFDDYLGAEGAEAMTRSFADAMGIRPTEIEAIGRGKWATLRGVRQLDEIQVRSLRRLFPHIKAVEPDRVYKPSAIPNDPFFGDQWAHDNIGQFNPFSGLGVTDADIDTTDAWNTTIGSNSVVVAVVDSGIDLTHPDLEANIWANPGEIPGNGLDDDGNGFADDVNGWDFGDLDNNPDDDAFFPWFGHGTQCAGVIGAVGNNGVGVAGIAWTVSLLAVKIPNQFGLALTSAIVGAHDYLTMMRGLGINIVASNNSYGAPGAAFYEDFPDGIIAERDAIEAFIASGGTFVAAAGNDSFDNDNDEVTFFPSSYKIPGLISVAATTNQDTIADFSNYGAEAVDIGAPGLGVLSTYPGGGYSYFAGTSCASPVVVGAVALLKSLRPDASAVEIRQAIIDSADPIPTLQNKVVSGGRLNVARALQIIGLDGPVLRRVDPGPVTGQISSTTGQPLNSITVTFNKPIDDIFGAEDGMLSTSAATLKGGGADNMIGTGDDVTVPITKVQIDPEDPKSLIITLNVSGFPLQRLPIDPYRLTLVAAHIKDVLGNFLNGDQLGGANQTYSFNVVGTSGDFETNDTLVQATPVNFNASGVARFRGVTLGDGIAGSLDVDLFRIDMARGGLIQAEVFAKRLPSPSTLDSYLRLFNAAGEEIARNDQFFGSDSFLDFFVSTGGTYYIGVSGFANDDYDPSLISSGSTQSTGAFDLTVTVELIAEDRLTFDKDLSGDPPRIPTQGTSGTITDVITITDSRQLRDVNITVDLDHTFVSDLKISLISPEGTEVLLFNRRGGAGDDLDGTIFDDEAVNTLAAGAAPFTGSYKPDVPLSTFDGQVPLGDWTLKIEDVNSLNFGQLNSWSLELTLENNIFGPFELNDTVSTARSVQEISGTGAASREAAIGDGGFGVLDRDLFRIVVAEGSTLTTTTTALPNDANNPASDVTVRTSIRIFDENGAEIISSGEPSELNSEIVSFVFAIGGTYYVAVSEAENLAYDPFDVTSGDPAATTGRYRLDIAVSSGVGDRPLVLDGAEISVGIAADGTFYATGEGDVLPTGLTFAGQELLFDRSNQFDRPTMFFGASASGLGFINEGFSSPTSLPISLIDQSDPFNSRVLSRGVFRGLSVERSISFARADSFVAFDVILTNTSGATMTGVSWVEALNSEVGYGLETPTGQTINDVDDAAPFASSRFVSNEFPQGITLALAAPASDSRASASFIDITTQVVRDPQQLLELPQNDPDGIAGDQTMTLAFELGSLPAGQSVSVRYFVFVGRTPGDVSDLYEQLNNGSGIGHLSVDPAQPAEETLSDGSSVPQLPYRVYYPEGFASSGVFEFVPILNPHAREVRVVAIARYETGERDQVIGDIQIAPNSRGGFTLSNPNLYANGNLLVRKDTPYAIELCADLPVAATFSHYDLLLVAGQPAAVGESFTAQVSDTWSFGTLSKGPGLSDFIIFLNTSDNDIKVRTTLYPADGSEPIRLTTQLEPGRRGGWNIAAESSVPNGEYGVLVEADDQIITALSHYDANSLVAFGVTGTPGAGTLVGAVPEGQIGLNSSGEVLAILNPSTASANVAFSFLFQGGSAYRTSLVIPRESRASLNVADLPGFPTNQPYSILYSSNVPITMMLPTFVFGDEFGAAFSDRAYTLWAFAEGFRPQNGLDSSVTEYLRLFNPQTDEVLVEITMSFDNGLGIETFRVTLAPRTVTELDVHQFVTGTRREVNAFYGITIKAADPIIAYMGHFDAFFPGGFGTLGTPLGASQVIAS